MGYLVTGATGLIGRNLVTALLRREGTIHVLVREGSLGRLEELRAGWGADADRVVAIPGDLTADGLGLGEADLERLEGDVDHLFHAAGLYDVTAAADRLHAVNVEGADRVLDLARRVGAGHVHFVSSIAVAGKYRGIWREDMFDEAEGLDSLPYLRAKHDAEARVRAAPDLRWRVYRPGLVVGDSRTGETDRADGPYHFFKLIQRLRGALPPWMPMVGVEGGEVNIVPVDFVAAAIDHIAHLPGEEWDRRAYSLTDPTPHTAGQVANVFARAAHAPQMGIRLDPKMLGVIPAQMRAAMAMLPPVRRIRETILADLGIPAQALAYVDHPTRFDARDATKALAGSGIVAPALESYATVVWDYWERNLDPDLFRDRSLAGAVSGQIVMITGASSGIGREAALKVAAAGGTVLLVARSADKLERLQAEIAEDGGEAHVHVCDLSDKADIDRMAGEVLERHGRVDILVNNAGRSIRRSLALSYDRLHDYERTMQLNYFGAVQLILRFMPGMRERRRGHLINISSIGVQANTPRFSAYVASKAALDAFSRCIASEVIDDDVHVTTIHMPLVRTPMIAPTKIYDAFPTIGADEAAEMISDAIVRRPKEIATKLGMFGELAYMLAPKATDAVLNTGYKLFPESGVVRDRDTVTGADEEVSTEGVAFAYLMRGVHW